LASAATTKRFSPSCSLGGLKPLYGGYCTPGHPPRWRYARNSGFAIYPNGATTALSLWATTIFYRTYPKLFSQHIHKRGTLIGHLNGYIVYGEMQQITATKPLYAATSEAASTVI